MKTKKEEAILVIVNSLIMYERMKMKICEKGLLSAHDTNELDHLENCSKALLSNLEIIDRFDWPKPKEKFTNKLSDFKDVHTEHCSESNCKYGDDELCTLRNY